MAKLTMASLKAKCKHYGAAIDDCSAGRVESFALDLPAGKTWKANGCHSIYGTWKLGDKEDKRITLEDMLEQIAYGVHEGRCEDEDCETCYPMPE
jgi:hypothetical protein